MAAMTISDPVDRVDQPEEDREHRDPENNGKSIHAKMFGRDPCGIRAEPAGSYTGSMQMIAPAQAAKR